MLARDYCTDPIKPVIISHHMLLGMKEGQQKMSKSDPDSAIFMEDSVDDVKRKVKKAYCPPQITEMNPVLDYVQYIILPAMNDQLVITIGKGDEKEEVVYTSYEE